MKTAFRKSIDSKDLNSTLEVVSSFGGTSEELDKVKTYVEGELKELGDNRLLFLLESEDKTIGVVQLILKNADGDIELANSSTIAHVHALQINKNFWKMGYASLMMRELENFAKKNGIKKLTLGVDGDNEKAMKLYEKLGYALLKEEEGLTPEAPLYYLYKEL